MPVINPIESRSPCLPPFQSNQSHSLTSIPLHREIPHNRRPPPQYGHDRLLPHNGPTTRFTAPFDAEIRPCREEAGSVLGAEEGRKMSRGVDQQTHTWRELQDRSSAILAWRIPRTDPACMKIGHEFGAGTVQECWISLVLPQMVRRQPWLLAIHAFPATSNPCEAGPRAWSTSKRRHQIDLNSSQPSSILAASAESQYSAHCSARSSPLKNGFLGYPSQMPTRQGSLISKARPPATPGSGHASWGMVDSRLRQGNTKSSKLGVYYQATFRG